jgi:hypothetical protein
MVRMLTDEQKARLLKMLTGEDQPRRTIRRRTGRHRLDTLPIVTRFPAKYESVRKARHHVRVPCAQLTCRPTGTPKRRQPPDCLGADTWALGVNG